MAYEGKFKDTCPVVSAAGIKNKPNYSVKDSLQEYTLQDAVHAVKINFHVPEKEYVPTKLPKIEPNPRLPESRDLIRPNVLTRYQQLINDLKESTYSSYWKKILATTNDSVPAFPEGRKVDEMTFGKPSIHGNFKFSLEVDYYTLRSPLELTEDYYDRSEIFLNENGIPVKELLYPSSDRELNQSRNDSSKQLVDRGYSSTSFNPDNCFGEYSGYDKQGLKVKCLLHWPRSSAVEPLNKIKTDFMQRNYSRLGKCFKANEILEALPDGHTFGKPYQRGMYAVEDLLREHNVPVSCEVRNTRIWLVSLNRLKMQIEKNHDTPEILYDRMRFADQNNTGFISFGQLLDIMRCNELFFNVKNIKSLMEYLGIIVNDRVDYVRFLDSVADKIMLNKVFDLTPDQLHLTTTYEDSCRNCFIPDDNAHRPNAGIPSHRFDFVKFANPFDERYVQLSDYTDMKACLQPSIFTQHFLSHRDFFCPRDKEFIRTLFCKVGYNINEENFEKLWKIALETDKTGKVCIQTFRDLLRQYYPVEKEINVDESLC